MDITGKPLSCSTRKIHAVVKWYAMKPRYDCYHVCQKIKIIPKIQIVPFGKQP